MKGRHHNIENKNFGKVVKKIRIHLQKVADDNIIESTKGWDCYVKEI